MTDDPEPDDCSMARTKAQPQQIFDWPALKRLWGNSACLLRRRSASILATTLEANAALRSIVAPRISRAI